MSGVKYLFDTNAIIALLNGNSSLDNLLIAEIKKATHLKLPDAIIAGTAIHYNAVLITNDKGFTKVPSLKIAAF